MSSDNEDSNIERNGANDDDDYDFAEDNNRGKNQRQGDDDKAQVIQNHHYDEAVEVSEGGSEVQSDPDPEQEEEEEQEEEQEKPSPPKKPAARFEPIKPSTDSDADDDKEDKQVPGAYNAANYADLPVSQEVSDLFKYITRYRPTTVDLETKLKAFIPDYIPAVGEVDAFLKPSKPDNNPENLGLLTIDEPCLNQSKESTIRLMMYANRKTVGGVAKKVVDSIENADKNPKEINKWIQDVSSIQRQAPSVGYSKPFPDIDTLMQVWPVEIEDALQNLRLPTGDIDMSLEEYVKLGCALVDIPVHNTTTGRNLIESLHVFFTLFAEFKANQHFQQNEQFVYEGTM